MNKNQKTKKQLFEAGFPFASPGSEGKLKLLVVGGREFIATVSLGQWIYFASIDAITDTSVLIHNSGADPTVLPFESLTFPESWR